MLHDLLLSGALTGVVGNVGCGARERVMEFRFGAQAIRVNMPRRDDLFDAVRSRFNDRQGFALATINLDHIVKLRDDARFLDAYAAQDFVVSDGNPIVWTSRLSGQDVELIPGSELVIPLTDIAQKSGVSIALVGSTEDALAVAAEHLKARTPGLEIAATISPAFGFDPTGQEADTIFEALNSSGAGLCFLALGAPKQEVFAARGRELSPGIGFASIGAGLDFLAGTQNRAPKWVQAIAMEWAWRMLSNPARLGPRYLKCMMVLPGLTVSAIQQRIAR